MTTVQTVDAPTEQWVMLVYRMPREPSTPRIAVWRKLRQYGVFQLADGVVVLPASPRTREQFDWLADEILESGGQAEVWTADPTTRAQQDRMRKTMSADRAAEYRDILTEAETVRDLEPPARGRKLARLRRRLREIDKRTFYPTAQRDAAEAVLRELATADPSVEVRR